MYEKKDYARTRLLPLALTLFITGLSSPAFADSANTVYVVEGGHQYHSVDCPRLRRIDRTRLVAMDAGRIAATHRACSSCDPTVHQQTAVEAPVPATTETPPAVTPPESVTNPTETAPRTARPHAIPSGGTVTRGARVRVTLPDGSRKTGMLIRLDSNTIVIRNKGDESDRAYAVPELKMIEKSFGSRRNRLKGFGVGVLGGAVFGAIVGFSAEPQAGPASDGVQRIGAGMLAGISYGLVGGLLGALIGMPSEEWNQLTHPAARFEVGAATSGDAALMLHARF